MLHNYQTEEFGHRLRDIRKGLNLTQQDVSDMSGVNLDTLRKLENGYVVPRYDTLEILSITYKIDLLEVLLRSVPQYLLFGALGLYLFAWIDKKPFLGKIAEIVLIVIAILALTVLLSGAIPSPKTEGLIEQDIKNVIQMLLMLAATGSLGGISLLIRFIRKKPFIPLIVLVFVTGLIVFFQSTKLSRVKFELNKTEVVTDTLTNPQK